METPVSDLAERFRGLADRYRIERELGRGGMATVYLADDLRHKRPVAVKVLHPDLALTLGPERFLREIETAARLQHPHILPIFDSGRTDGYLWYTMPYVEGESLRDCLRREGQLGLDEAVRITREVAEALEYAHTQGVVHRDIKPENILLSRGHALVADFGIARATDPDETANLTATGLAVGTAIYMSPEQAAGGRVDGRSDQYSLGCVLYETLAGEPPHTGTSARAIAVKRMTTPPAEVRLLRPGVHEWLAEAVHRALQQVPGDRYGTMAGFARALEPQSVRGPSAPTHPPPASTGPNQPVIKSWVGGALVMGLAAAAAGVIWQRTATTIPIAEGPARLAVLPFVNLGDSADSYFAAGLTDEIRAKLSTVPTLQVIASTSSDRYRGTGSPPEQVARELGARYLLVGRVRWAKGAESARVRVDPELMQVDVSGTATIRWQQPFDAPLTDVFEVQADIAQRVARELQLSLSDAEADALGRRPTSSLAAYDAYLRGLEYDRRGGDPTSDEGLAAYAEAIRLDSNFALAWSGLGWTYLRRFRGLRNPEIADSARMAIDRALALAPDLAEAHARDGEYQTFVRHDPQAAMAAYRRGLQLAPTDALLLNRSGWAEMRLGRWDSALTHLSRAAFLDPRSAVRVSDLGFAYLALRRFAEAKVELDKAMTLEPAAVGPLDRRVRLALSEGDVGKAQTLVRAAGRLDLPIFQTDLAIWILDRSQLEKLVTDRSSPSPRDCLRKCLMISSAYFFQGDSANGRRWADSARAAYRHALPAAPEDAEIRAGLGLAEALLGDATAAVAEGDRAAALAPFHVDALAASGIRRNLIWIYLLGGKRQEAIRTVEELLRRPGTLTVGWLRVDPNLAPLRDLPQFEQLLRGASN